MTREEVLKQGFSDPAILRRLSAIKARLKRWEGWAAAAGTVSVEIPTEDALRLHDILLEYISLKACSGCQLVGYPCRFCAEEVG